MRTPQNAGPRGKSPADPAFLIGTSRSGRPGTINLVAIREAFLSNHVQKAGIIACPPRRAISGALLCRAGPHKYRPFVLRRIYKFAQLAEKTICLPRCAIYGALLYRAGPNWAGFLPEPVLDSLRRSEDIPLYAQGEVWDPAWQDESV